MYMYVYMYKLYIVRRRPFPPEGEGGTDRGGEMDLYLGGVDMHIRI